jgi:transcriptional regulator with XRE-family HTH domain
MDGDRTGALLVHEIRTNAHLSQAELARRAGMPRSVINAYERGTRQPRADALARIAGAAGMELRVVPRPRVDFEKAGRILAQVLDLAEALPQRRRGPLAYPVLSWRAV